MLKRKEDMANNTRNCTIVDSNISSQIIFEYSHIS